MTKTEIQNYISEIIVDGYEPEVYSLLKINDAFILKSFLAEDSLLKQLKNTIDSLLKDKILNDDFVIEDSSKIIENQKVYYEIIQNTEYKPFEIINNKVPDSYKETDQINLKGFFIKINLNSKCFWIYQHKYPVTLINKKSSIMAILNGQNRYEPLTVDVVKFDKKIDMIIINDSIITQNIDLMQREFSFNKYIRLDADRCIKKIKTLGILSSIDILQKMSGSEKLTTAKKLMSIRNSKTMGLTKNELFDSVRAHSVYKNLFKFDEGKRTIIVSSQKDILNFLKMMNDDYLHSELTRTDYDTSSKHEMKINKAK
ncbi:MAG: DUF4868 domain-containing protein [Treponema sp.]|nr:DUF4868 domain-containing protein [Treponema sp.]